MQLLKQRPSVSVFVLLQVLDVLTTLIGLHLGAGKASLFISRLMRVGPRSCADGFKDTGRHSGDDRRYARIVGMANFWLAAVVTWNLALMTARAGVAPRS